MEVNRDFFKVSGDKPMLIVVVDTEEEFDWNKFPDREATAVKHMESLELTQSICREFGLAPCYVIDYPIATTPLSIDALKPYVANNECEIGAHLHPWVNPPLTEELSYSNMYPGNLSQQLEYDKLANLKEAIETNFGVSPVSYKAGRYGFGKNTLKTIEKLGFKVDLSHCPPMDHSADGGPNYSRTDSRPFYFAGTDIMEIPLTGGFTGVFGQSSPSVYQAAQKLVKLKVPGILSKAKLLDRLVLSPEGYTSEEHISLTKHLYRQGLRIFTWSFHSPTVVPGNTMYVTSEREKQLYLDKFRRFFDFFFNELNGEATTPKAIYKMMENK